MLKMLKPRFVAAIATLAVAIALIAPPPSRSSQASCIMPTSGTVSGLTLVNDINGCNNSLISVWSGASAPSGAQAGQFWFNTNINYVQEYDGTSWISLWYVDSSNHLLTPQIGGGSVAASISSGSTTDLGSVPQPYKAISGTTTINSFGSSAPIGSVHFVVFSGVLTLTYNAGSMVLPGQQSITTQGGDVAEAIYLGAGNWRVLRYTLISTPVKTTPATTDYILIQDVAAANATKKSLISQLLTLVGVTSIDSKTGTFTTGNGLDSTGGNVIELTAARRTLPTTSVVTISSHSGGFSANSSGTYTSPPNCTWFRVRMVGGGGGGAGGSLSTAAGTGGNTTFTSFSAFGGVGGIGGGTSGAGGAGGSAGNGDINIQGSGGAPGNNSNAGGSGGASYFGGAGSGAQPGTVNGGNASPNSGSGGGGGSGGTQNGGGGGAGGYLDRVVACPQSGLSFGVGAGGGGTSGTSVGGNGAGGMIAIDEHYGS
jgi:hypothetical protein